VCNTSFLTRVIYGSRMHNPSIYADRRARFMETIGDRAVAVFHSLPQTLRNSDVHHRYRQCSDMLYLTGFAEPGTTVVLRPGADSERFVMFVRPRDPERETWNGRRAGVEGARERYGADAAFPGDELDAKLLDLVANTDELYYVLGDDPTFDLRIGQLLAELRGAERRGKHAPLRLVDPRSVVHEMRLLKTTEEIAALRRAADISVAAHEAAMRDAAPGGSEWALEAVIDYTFRSKGGVGPGYPTIVGAGDNGTILHYTENECELRDGDLVLIDAGCEYEFYSADITRTFPVNGKFNDAQRRCYELVLAAQEAAIAAARPGVTLDALHDICVRILTEGMVELGWLAGPAADRIEDAAYKRFYLHRTSHWLGMDVHDVGAYTRNGEPRPLEPGMVITIEPGLYVPLDADDIPAAYRGIGIRIEDDLLITETGNENLTVGAPKQIDDVEAACVGT